MVFAQPFNDLRLLLWHNFKRFEADDNQGNKDNNGERECGEHQISFLGLGVRSLHCAQWRFQAALNIGRRAVYMIFRLPLSLVLMPIGSLKIRLLGYAKGSINNVIPSLPQMRALSPIWKCACGRAARASHVVPR